MTTKFVVELTESVQSRLLALGFYTGAIDGIVGPLTEQAVTNFKAAHGLLARPYPGPLTLALLFSESALSHHVTVADDRSIAPWYFNLLEQLGKHEKANNIDLRSYLRSDGSTLGDPSILPWCGDAVETAIKNTVKGAAVPANPYLAKNWAAWGKYVAPTFGCIMVFHNGDPKSPYGHVAFYSGEDKDAYRVLGGNQSNSVSITRIAKSRLRPKGSRWPSELPTPKRDIRVQSGNVALSTSER